MTTNSDQKLAIVTGAAAGIGLAIAKALGSKGFNIAIVDLDEKQASNAAILVEKETGARTCYAVANVIDPEACRHAYAEITKRIGPSSVLVNNAGIVVRRQGRLEELPEEDLDEMMAIHVGGSLNWSRVVIPDMRKAGFGRIINISSCNAVTAVPYRIGYVTAKKAIRGLTEALALETARAGITVNAIAPGYILTDTLKHRIEIGLLNQTAIAEKTPLGRWGEADEIGKAAAFLASGDADYITGTTLVVDGGYTIRGDAGEDLENSPFGKI